MRDSTPQRTVGDGSFREEALEHAPRDPDHAAVFADLDPELHRLPLGVPAGILGHTDRTR
jgi:hypothetical protein